MERGSLEKIGIIKMKVDGIKEVKMARALPGDTRPRSKRLISRLIEEYGIESVEVLKAWKLFRVGYHAAVDDFLDASTVVQENNYWYNDEPTLQAVRRRLGLRRSRRR